MKYDLLSYNKNAWNKQVEDLNPWTIPVSSEEIKKAKNGQLEIVLTPEKKVPQEWFPKLSGLEVLALASGGGQQGPLLAAAGAQVTVFDNSPLQLERDKEVALREGLFLKTVEGDMRDLSVFADESFDFIVHPCSNCFVDQILPVWRECYRVLRVGGTMIAGIVNPIAFMLDPELEKKGIAQLKFALPYSDLESITEEQRIQYFGKDDPLSFGHTLEDQIGGQILAGFQMIGFYEDRWSSQTSPLHKLMSAYIATRVIKLKS